MLILTVIVLVLLNGIMVYLYGHLIKGKSFAVISALRAVYTVIAYMFFFFSGRLMGEKHVLLGIGLLIATILLNAKCHRIRIKAIRENINANEKKDE